MASLPWYLNHTKGIIKIQRKKNENKRKKAKKEVYRKRQASHRVPSVRNVSKPQRWRWESGMPRGSRRSNMKEIIKEIEEYTGGNSKHKPISLIALRAGGSSHFQSTMHGVLSPSNMPTRNFFFPTNPRMKESVEMPDRDGGRSARTPDQVERASLPTEVPKTSKGRKGGIKPSSKKKRRRFRFEITSGYARIRDMKKT